MKAAVIHALGQPPRFEDFPEPTAGEGEVGVNVRAAGLHPFVRAQASGSQSGSPNVLWRHAQVLNELPPLGADVTISLNQPDQQLIEAIASAASPGGIHVILDYLWGRPTEAVIAAISRLDVTQGAPSVRLIDLGQI